ncbi:MAG: hypothetical protein L3J47_00320 [Sulfurovum sp.]|nr:hypothetical protein [Sulfurovum sp.]
MLEIFLLLLSLLNPEGRSQTQVGKGTTFYPVEKGLNNGILGCTGERWVDPIIPYCASRTIPCGTWVYISNLSTKKVSWCKVMDRGPYGKYDSSGKWFNAATDRKAAKKAGTTPRTGTYRAIIDMGSSVSNQLGAKGLARVKVRWWRSNKLAPLLDRLLLPNG